MAQIDNKVRFYYNPMSRGRIVHWMLEECGAEYEIKLLKWETKDHKSPEYLKINPMGQIPAIQHRGVTVTECAGICAYLADAFPESRLAPEVGNPERGAYYRWLFFAASDIEPAMTDQNFPRARAAPSTMLGYSSYDDVVSTMEKAVSNGYLAGNRFSAADLYMASQIGWCLLVKSLPARPVFLNYLRLCEDRPGYRRFLEKAGPIG